MATSRAAAMAWAVLAAWITAGCSAAGPPGNANPAASSGVADCIAIEVQNTSLQGVTVWAVWDGSAQRQLGRIGLNGRRTFKVPFRNDQVSLRFQRDGSSSYTPTNAVLPTPGDRLDVVYRQNGPGVFRRVGVTRC